MEDHRFWRTRFSVSWREVRGDRSERIHGRSRGRRTDDLRCVSGRAVSARLNEQTSTRSLATGTRMASRLYQHNNLQLFYYATI